MSFAFLSILFTAVAVYYGFRALQLAWQMWQDRQILTSDFLTPQQVRYAEAAAFLLAVPPGVFAHELGHAIATWAVGGTVAEFRVFGYWGYVLPIGNFSLVEDWFIAVAGTVASLVYTVLIFAVLGYSKVPFRRYLALRSARFHVFFTLVYYPLFTALTAFGDWRTIYNFEATPLLSTITAVIHAILLFIAWRLDRQGAFDMPYFNRQAQVNTYTHALAIADQHPNSQNEQAEAVKLMWQHGLRQQSRHRLAQTLKHQPNWAGGHLLMGLMLKDGKSAAPDKAVKHVEQALALGIDRPAQNVQALQFLGQVAFEKGQTRAALEYLDRCAELMRSLPDFPPEHAHRPYHIRSRIQRQVRQYEHSAADLRIAIDYAKQAGHAKAIKLYEQDLSVLEQHRRTA